MTQPDPLPPSSATTRAEKKSATRAQLLSSAKAQFDVTGFGDVKMGDVAAAAGVAKGTVFVHFESKEALFLALTEDELFAWLTVVDDRLRSLKRPTTKKVAALLAETLQPRSTLTRLLTILSSVLERNVDEDVIAAWKGRLLARLANTGVLLERTLPFLRAGDGARALLQIDAVVVGLRQLSDPGPAALRALQRPALAPLLIDFDRELLPLLTALLTGLERQHR